MLHKLLGACESSEDFSKIKIDLVVEELDMRFYIFNKPKRKVNVIGSWATLQSSKTAEDSKPISQRIWIE